MITEIIDRYLDEWVERGLNAIPGPIPPEMMTGETDDDWNFWVPIQSTVSSKEIEELQNTVGIQLSPQYVALLRHKHFIELQIGQVCFTPHPNDSWRLEISKVVFEGWPREWLIDKGYMPFASYSDWGMWCFGTRNQPTRESTPSTYGITRRMSGSTW